MNNSTFTAQDIHFKDNLNQHTYMSSSGNFENVSFKLQMGDILGEESDKLVLKINDSKTCQLKQDGGTNGNISVQGNISSSGQHQIAMMIVVILVTHIDDSNTKITFTVGTTGSFQRIDITGDTLLFRDGSNQISKIITFNPGHDLFSSKKGGVD